MTDVADKAAGIETGSDELLVSSMGDHVVVLSMNRPDRRNALSEGIYDGFARALPQVAGNPSVRVLVITGAGGAFCAGGDVKAMNERNQTRGAAGSRQANVTELRERQRRLSLALRELPQPVVALLPGPAAGAGLSIALAADLRLATRSAVLVTAFSSVGGSGDFGGSWFLPRLIGESKAKELYFLSPRLGAEQAAELGLVNRVFDDDTFASEAESFCLELAGRPPVALRYMKENINRAAGCSLNEALDAEAEAMTITMATNDHREAAAAFVEKRSPTFTGR